MRKTVIVADLTTIRRMRKRSTPEYNEFHVENDQGETTVLRVRDKAFVTLLWFLTSDIETDEWEAP